MKLHKFLTIAFFAILGTVNAQEGALSGSLKDQKEEVIPFATVAVMKLPDSTVVTGTTTDLDGIFEVDTPKNGEYVLRFSAIGFKTTFTEPFKVSDPAYARDFGQVTIQEEMTMLNEVMVQAWRPRVEMEAGKMVVRVEGTAMAAGSSAYEVVSKSPGISADQDGSLQLNGKRNVNIMINGRLTYLSTEQLKTMLESMPAENIKNIELIHTPSAKYDAAGSAGIINIELRENVNMGFNGSVYGGAEFKKENWYNMGTNLNYQKGQWNTFFSADLSKTGFIREQKVFREFTFDSEYDYYEQIGDQLNSRWIPSFQGGLDYQINKKHSIGAIASYTFFNESRMWDTKTRLGNFGEGDLEEITSENSGERSYNNGRFNIHYVGNLDTLGTRLTVDMDYVQLSNDRDSYFHNNYFFPLDDTTEEEYLFNRSISSYDIFAAKADLVLPVNETSELTMGVKGSSVISDSDLKFYVGEEGNREFDDTRSNSFRYEEQIYAAHGSYSTRLSDKWSVQAGLRAEKTVGKGISPTMGEVNEVDYLDLFPNLQISQKVTNNYEINYSYSRRINRPDYSKLNPFLFYLDPYSYIVGNAKLEAEKTSSFGLNQSLFGKYLLMLNYSYTSGVMREYPSVNKQTGQTVYTTANLDDMTMFSGTLVVPVKLASFWNVENTAVITQTNYDIPYEEGVVENDNLYYSFQSNHRINLPWETNMELNGKYLGPVASGIYTVGERWYLDLGLKKTFLNDKLDVTLKATDIFKGMKMNVYAEYPGSTFDMEQYLYDRGISINLRYRFNGKKGQKETRQKSLEELNRAGG